jgi:uncharacterized membrane protein
MDDQISRHRKGDDIATADMQHAAMLGGGALLMALALRNSSMLTVLAAIFGASLLSGVAKSSINRQVTAGRSGSSKLSKTHEDQYLESSVAAMDENKQPMTHAG